MSVIAIIAALVLEQWRPLGDRRLYSTFLADAADRLERAFNAEQGGQGLIAWLVAVVPTVVAAYALHALLGMASPLLALLFDIAVLYLTLGFRQFSHSFTAIQVALKAGELDRARELIADWRGEPVAPHTREEVVRLSVEEALLASHRHVFGVLLWYVLLPGPSGAILYRLAAFLRRRWGGLGAFGDFARRAQFVLEWPAVRLTAAAFAVVGDFEDAVYCWRTQAHAWPDPNAGVVLASGAGAIGVRLGMPLAADDGHARPELGVGNDADVPALDATVGLLWRALVVWVFVLVLLSLGRVLG
jgi:adenosylcobinamide-phosphate synthase